MSFKELGISAELMKVLSDNRMEKPFPIQEKAIPALLNGSDVLGIAPTGSGKTAAYVLPLLMKMGKKENTKNRHIEALVLVPTRELAMQVNKVFQQFSLELNDRIKTLAVYGGVSVNPQMIALQSVQILVATPGRLLELVESNAVNLSQIKTLVLDEADKMLNIGFQKEMYDIFGLLPAKRQNVLFSATLSNDIKSIRQLILNNPEVIQVDVEDEDLSLIQQTGYFVTEEQKGPLLRHLIREKNLKQVLVFVSSIKRADNVANKLRNNGIEAWPVHSKKSQGARTDLLTKFKHGKLPVLVTTDLLSRGIDIEFLPTIINYELPRSPKDFIHRIGRTGRAENPGEAISFVTPDDKHHFRVIQKKMGRWVTMIDSEGIEF